MSKLQHRYQNYLIIAILFSLPFYFIRLKYGWASLNLIEILILILAVLWLFNRKTKDILHSAKYFRNYIFPTILILFGVSLSIIFNKNFHMGLGILKGWFIFPIVFASVLFGFLKEDHKLLGKIFVTLFASGFIISLVGIYYKLSGILTYDGRLRIFYDSPNQLAMFIAPTLLIGVFILGQKKLFWERALIWVGIILNVSNLYLTKSFGSWMAVGLALVIIMYFRYREKMRWMYFLLPLIFLLFFLGITGAAKYKSIENLGDRSSLMSRIMIWKSAGAMLKDNPFFGIGAGNFQNKYLEYQKYYPPYLEWSVPQPHNLFLAFWLETGFIGFLGFILLLIQFFKDNRKVYLLAKINKNNDNFIREKKRQTSDSLHDKEYFGGGAIGNDHLYGVLCLAIMIYFLIHGLVDTTYWRNDMAFLFWVIVSVNLYLVSKKETQQIETRKL